MEAEGRAADEAAARRKLRACPLANAEAARFVKRPPGTKGLRALGTGKAGHRTSVQDPPRQRRDFGLRVATGGKGASASDPSGRTGLRPGGCEAAGTQSFGSWTCQAEPRLRPRIPPEAVSRASARGSAKAGKRDFGPESAKRRTARASALTGSPRGNRIELRLLSDSGGSGAGACLGFRHSKSPGAKGLAFQARSDAKGQWGLAARSAPIIF